MDPLADPLASSLTLMAATMIEMDDGAQLRTWTAGPVIPQRLPVVMVHGGPGVPDYLAPVAGIVEDLCLVHRYDQRGTGGSPWRESTRSPATFRTWRRCSMRGDTTGLS